MTVRVDELKPASVASHDASVMAVPPSPAPPSAQALTTDVHCVALVVSGHASANAACTHDEMCVHAGATSEVSQATTDAATSVLSPEMLEQRSLLMHAPAPPSVDADGSQVVSSVPPRHPPSPVPPELEPDDEPELEPELEPDDEPELDPELEPDDEPDPEPPPSLGDELGVLELQAAIAQKAPHSASA